MAQNDQAVEIPADLHVGAAWLLFSRSIVHPAKTPRVEIVEGLVDFLLAVHHERAMANDGFVDRLATEQQHNGIVIGLQAQLDRKSVV